MALITWHKGYVKLVLVNNVPNLDSALNTLCNPKLKC